MKGIKELRNEGIFGALYSFILSFLNSFIFFIPSFSSAIVSMSAALLCLWVQTAPKIPVV